MNKNINCPANDPNANNDPCSTKRRYGIPCGFEDKGNKQEDGILNLFRG